MGTVGISDLLGVFDNGRSGSGLAVVACDENDGCIDFLAMGQFDA
jgi:hypothetical protein